LGHQLLRLWKVNCLRQPLIFSFSIFLLLLLSLCLFLFLSLSLILRTEFQGFMLPGKALCP
jgi:hypothetical protein